MPILSLLRVNYDLDDYWSGRREGKIPQASREAWIVFVKNMYREAKIVNVQDSAGLGDV